MQIWGPVSGTKPNVRRSHICGTLLNCFCGFQSFAVCACACVSQSVCPSRRWRAKSFTYAVMHACCAAGPASWSCRTIYACAKYGGTAHFYLYRLLAPFVVRLWVCVDGLFRLVVSNIEMLSCNAFTSLKSLAAGHKYEMATNGDISMISPPTSSISNDQDPFGQLPPLPPPLRSTQVLQPLSVFPGAQRANLFRPICSLWLFVVVCLSLFCQLLSFFIYFIYNFYSSAHLYI